MAIHVANLVTYACILEYTPLPISPILIRPQIAGHQLCHLMIYGHVRGGILIDQDIEALTDSDSDLEEQQANRFAQKALYNDQPDAILNPLTQINSFFIKHINWDRLSYDNQDYLKKVLRLKQRSRFPC